MVFSFFFLFFFFLNFPASRSNFFCFSFSSDGEGRGKWWWWRSGGPNCSHVSMTTTKLWQEAAKGIEGERCKGGGLPILCLPRPPPYHYRVHEQLCFTNTHRLLDQIQLHRIADALWHFHFIQSLQIKVRCRDAPETTSQEPSEAHSSRYNAEISTKAEPLRAVDHCTPTGQHHEREKKKAAS